MATWVEIVGNRPSNPLIVPVERSLKTCRVLLALVLAVAMIAVGVGSVPPSPSPVAAYSGSTAPRVLLVPQSGPPASNNVSYTSSVDGFPLSYLEWLPSAYTPSGSYPLAVFLHGVGSTSNWESGGVGGQVDVTESLATNASAAGFILIALNTRSSAGFYVDTPCGGPQEQDVLDAIAHEKALRPVASTYLIGFSMGSLGSFSIAGHHPGLISGIATAGSITDVYETIAYNQVTRSEPHGLFDAMCGAHPGPSAPTVDRVWTYLSVLRFHPQNFTGIGLFVASGGEDTRAPNNFGAWAYANVNNTFVNATCDVATALGEPANCTVPFATLSNQSPTAYRWLDLYEPHAPHSTDQLPGAAVFDFFLHRISGGFFVSTFPGGELTPYTPGTPLPSENGSSPAPLSNWVWWILGGAAAGAVAVGVVATRRRGR